MVDLVTEVADGLMNKSTDRWITLSAEILVSKSRRTMRVKLCFK